MLFLPCTRRTNVDKVVRTFDKSDIPKQVILLLDAPCTAEWYFAFHERGWDIDLHITHNDDPPTDRVGRRARHIAMRKLSQALTVGCDRVLYSEDDTLVPADTWSRLNRVMDSGFYGAASGVQRDRHGSALLGVWSYTHDAGCFDPLPVNRDTSVVTADAVGHYCLLADGYDYAAMDIASAVGSVDRHHTAQLAPIGVDTRVWCGHILDDGTVIE